VYTDHTWIIQLRL